MRLLLLRLEGLLQSWGERSRWDNRDTASMPTKSGIAGLLGCCMGIPQGHERLAAIAREIMVAVRSDRAGLILTDFHTVQKKGRLMTADGRGKKENTIVSYRQYLQDASFLAAVHAEDSILDECIYALKHPVWTPYLGRKSCVPTKPIFAGETTCYDTLEQALRQVPRTERSDLVNRIIWESENGTVIRQDTPIDAQKRVFGWSRYEDGSVITEGKVNV